MRRVSSLLGRLALSASFVGLCVSCVESKDVAVSHRAGTMSGTCNDDRECGVDGACVSDPAGGTSCLCSEGLVGTNCEWSAETVLEEFALAAPVDANAWNRDEQTGLHFRHATEKEMKLNEWAPGTFVVEAGTLFDAMSAGRDDIGVVLPETLTSSRVLGLMWITEKEGPGFVEMSGTVEGKMKIDAGRPVFHKYASQIEVRDGRVDLLGAVVTGTAVDGDRQLIIHGHVERAGETGASVDWIRITPVNSHVQLEALPGPGVKLEDLLLVQWSPGAQPYEELPSQTQNLCPPAIVTDAEVGDPWTPIEGEPEPYHPCVEPGGNGGSVFQMNQCTNGFDDDGDELTDDHSDPMCKHTSACDPTKGHPDHVHEYESGLDYGQFGDVVWCTKRQSSWVVEMEEQAAAIRDAFRAPAHDNDDYNDWVSSPGQTLVWQASKCWMLGSVDEARDCRDNLSDCGPYAAGQHTYPYKKSGRTYWSQHIERGAADLYHAVNLPEHLNIDHPLQMWFVIVNEGLDDFANQNITWAGKTAENYRGATINGDQPGITPKSFAEDLAHEFGHIFGCGHCDARAVPTLEVSSEENQPTTYQETEVDGHSFMWTSDDDAYEYCSVDVSGLSNSAHRFGSYCSRDMVDDNTNEFNTRDAFPPTFGTPLADVPWSWQPVP